MGTSTVSSNKRSKAIKSALAVGLALLLALGGTFAWVNAQNEVGVLSDESLKNPGGRLHDDFIWTADQKNKDVYVENFTSATDGKDIFARVRLRECLEKSSGGASQTIPSSADPVKKTGWNVYDYTNPENCEIHNNFHLKFGGKTKYMPTFNKDKDSIEPDVNGSLSDPESGEIINYSNYVDYTKVTSVTAEERLGGGSTGSPVVHNAKDTLESSIKLMTDWTAEGCKPGPFWVYDNTEDTDANGGWFYWAQAIAPNTATGLLLDNVELIAEIEGGWRYQIDVVGEFVTAEEPNAIVDASTGAKTYYLDRAGTRTLSANAYSLLKSLIDPRAVLDAPVAMDNPSASLVSLEGRSYYKLAQNGNKVMLLSKDLVAEMQFDDNSDVWSRPSESDPAISDDSKAKAWCNKETDDGYIASLPAFTRSRLVLYAYKTKTNPADENVDQENPAPGTYYAATSKVFLLTQADICGGNVDFYTYKEQGHLIPYPDQEGKEILIAKTASGSVESWWARSPRTRSTGVTLIRKDGISDITSYSSKHWVRPAFWVDLGTVPSTGA